VKGRKRALLIYACVFFAYALLTLAMTWPAVTQLTTHLLGSGDDMWVHYWNNWWVKRVLQQGINVYYTPLLFHPTGVSLVYHNFAWVNIALWLALEPLTGGIAAYNLVHLVHIPLCGLGMFALAHRLTKSRAAAFIAGLVYAFWPYRMLDTNHPNMISTEGFPLLMLALWNLFRSERPIRNGLLAGILLALIGYMRWQLLILAGFMIVLYLLYSLICEPERWSRRVIGGLALMAVVAIMLMTPALLPLVQETLASDSAKELYTVSTSDPEQDLLAWIIPQHQHPLGELHTRIFSRYGRNKTRVHHSAFLGYVAVGLSMVGVVKRRGHRQTWFWLGLAALCFVFALGPSLQFDGVEYPRIPLPYRLIGWLPPVQMLRHPHRFTALLGLPVAVLTGYGASALQTWLTRRRQGRERLVFTGALTVILGGLIMVDYLSIPTDMVSTRVPAFYAALGEEPGDFAIMGLPGRRQITEHYMFYQTVHGRPLLSGHVSRLPSQAMAFAKSVPLVAGIYKSATGGIKTDVPDVSRQLASLSEAGFRYIIIHKELTTVELVNEWRSYLAVAPRYEDSEVAVYSTAPVAGEDFILEHDLGTGVGIIQTDLKRIDSALELEIVWGTTAPPGKDFQTDISFVDEEGGVGQTQRFEISPAWPSQEWPANAIVRDRFSVEAEPDLDEGIYAVVVGLVRDGQTVGQAATVGSVVVARGNGGISVFPLARRIDARFGDEMRLLGYGLEVKGDEAHVILHWQALRQMEDSYKFFLHLDAAEGGALVAQADVIPHGWTHPTSQWQVGEIVPDEIILSLEEVPVGEYQLWVGVYQPETGKRLPIDDVSAPIVVHEDRLMLPEGIAR
jgi:predicted cobalt transporter CbtA